MNKLKTISKPNRFLLYLGGIIIIIGLFGGGLLSFLVTIDDPISLNEVTEAGEFTTVDVEVITDYFATLETDRKLIKYYLVTEEDNMYIAIISDEDYQKLENMTSKTPIVGTSESIPRDIQDYAAEYIAETLDISVSDASELIYPYLINTYKTKNRMINDIAIIFGAIAVAGLLLIMVYVNKHTKRKKSINKFRDALKQINEELESDKTYHNPTCKIYLTDNYLISYNNGINIIKLNDITWIYPYEVRTKGIVTSKSIYIYTKDKQRHVIGNTNNWGKNKDNAYNELYQNLLAKTPDAFHGYSKEYKEKVT